jgi:hypothetical protein
VSRTSFENYAKTPDSEASKIVSEGLLFEEYLKEAEARRIRAKLLLDFFENESLLHRLTLGSSPGLFPLGLEKSEDERRIIANICQRLGLASANYHFNQSLAPLNPHYTPCVAVPIHSMTPLERLSQLSEELRAAGLR